MSARKSTHKKLGVKKIDPIKKYEVKQLGPLCPEFGKRRVKNAKGRPVTKYYLKKTENLRCWINWQESFGDKQKEGYHQSTWSAEPQSNLIGEEIQNALQTSLSKKQVWPWPSTSEEGFEEKRDLLKKAGFKEWKSNAGKRQDWLLTNPLQTEAEAAVSEDEESEGQVSDHEEEDEV